MKQKEYEQKKREYWEEFCIKNPAFNDMLGRKIFNQIYDRAYVLGQKKDPITQEEIERAAEKHADGLKVSSTIPGVMVPILHDIAKDSYICGAQDTLGKQEKDEKKSKRMCLRDKSKVCNKCHECDIDPDEWVSRY